MVSVGRSTGYNYNNKIVVAVSLISGDGNLLPLCIKINARLTPNEWLQKRTVRSACYSMYCFLSSYQCSEAGRVCVHISIP